MTMELPPRFAELCSTVIRENRLRLGLSQEALAGRAKMARSYICDVERGARLPSLRNLAIISGALELPVSKLVEETELKMACLLGDLFNLGQSPLEREILEYYSRRMNAGIVIATPEGKFVYMNPAADSLGRDIDRDAPIDDWSERFGCYLPDTTTLYPSRKLPLVRVLSGEVVHAEQLFLRNQALPQGRHIRVWGRPIQDNAGQIKGGVILIHDEKQFA